MLLNTLSEILRDWTTAKQEPYTQHPIAQKIRDYLPIVIQNIIDTEYPEYIIEGSAGAGNWANVPWLSILNPSITKSTTDGVYPVYLFCADGSGVYLSLNQGTSKPRELLGKKAAEARAQEITAYIRSSIPGISNWGLENITLNATTPLGKSYEAPNIVARFYSANAMPSEDELISDLKAIMSFYKSVEPLWKQFNIESTTDVIQTLPNAAIMQTRLPKPFLLLAGISGTGKTRFVREQAASHRADLSNYCLIPVRPDWHEPSDLLGHVSRIGAPHYVVTDLLCFVVAAWKEAVASATADGIQNKAPADMTPYWLCLDEMNLAPVEQYFADYLAVLETRSWNGDGYSCAPLLKADAFNKLPDNAAKMREDLKLAGTEYDGLWAYFMKTGIPLPPNLIVAGTVNMDETTHGFSRKVIDRAFTIDFGAFYPNDFGHYFAPVTKAKTLGFPCLSAVLQTDLAQVHSDEDGQKSIAFLNAINDVLKNTPFELAFRALNELLISLVCFNPKDAAALQAVWDDFLMTKVLPRIDGDSHKLGETGEGSLLTKLASLTAAQCSDIWDTTRIDLLRESTGEKSLEVPCRSKAKLAWMQERLESNGFTSFWP
jgi:MrcB-like, N-terminal domain